MLLVPGTSNVLVTLFLFTLSGKIKKIPKVYAMTFGIFING